MYFKRLEIHGFKSFAEPVVIDFHEGITAIVGPNGSGKSNISDAIKWVLGEQSPKALRGGKMEEVIFAGTASRKSRGMAEVTLVIDNSTHILDIEYSEVSICRRMYRSGESEYLINNNHCRLKDIRELIMDTGIGVDGYSIIGQGKIADIISNKTESRREIFEEAAGVVLYKTKKAEAEKKLANSQINLDRAGDIIGEIEGRIEGLAKDSENAREYLKLKERYEELEINIILKNIEGIQDRDKVYRDDIERLTSQIAQIEDSKSELLSEIDNDKSKEEELDQKGRDCRERLLEITKEISEITSSQRVNAERLSSITENKKRLEEEKEDLTSKIFEEKTDLESLLKSKEEIVKKHASFLADLREREREREEALAREEERNSKARDLEEQVFRLYDRIKNSEGDIKYYNNYLETLSRQRDEIKGENASFEENQRELEEILEKEESRLFERNQARKVISNTIDDGMEELAQIKKEKENLTARLDSCKQEYSGVKGRQKAMEDMENAHDGYSYGVKHILGASLRGIKGAVGDLIKVPRGLELAIETSLGSAIQNIVVETSQDGKAAIEELKRARAGRLTFLPIKSIKGGVYQQERELIGRAGYKGLAVDLVKFDSSHRTVMENLLGKVAIWDSLENAMKEGRNLSRPIKIVTLDGDVISPSGAMTGGSSKGKNSGILSRKVEIERLEKEASILKEEGRKIREEISEADERLIDLEDIISSSQGDLKEIEIEIASLNARIKSAREGVRLGEESRKKHEGQLDTIGAEIDNAKAEIEGLEADVESLTEDREKASRLLELAIKEGEKEKEARASLSEKITEAKILVSNWKEKKSNIEGLEARLTESISQREALLEKNISSIEILILEAERLSKEQAGGEDQDRELREEEKRLQAEIDQIEVMRKELKEKISQRSKEQEEAFANLNNLGDQRYQLELKRAKGETQLETLKDRLWEDFELSYGEAITKKIEDFPLSSGTKESRALKSRINALGDVNIGAIKEYEEVKERYDFLTEQRQDIVLAMDELRGIIADMERNIKERFKENFERVVAHFEAIFGELFGGGHAELRLEDPSRPLESNIEIIAQPPGKKLQNINLLSGGEKTMTAIALMFAVLKTRPTPFCILDEVEAALDDRNIDRFGEYLRKLPNIQFALVTHQRATMEHADVLYGVTMAERGVSKVLSLRLGDDFKL